MSAGLGFAQQPQAVDHYALAEAYFAKQEYDKALIELEKTPADFKGKKLFYELKRDIFYAQEDFAEAEDLMREWRKKDARNKHHYEVDLLFVYRQQEEDRKAERLIEDILEEIERQPARAYVYGKAFQDAGYPKLALNAYEKGEELNPQMNFDYQKALLYGELGEIQKMYGMYVEMVANRPGYLNSVKVLLSRALGEDQNPENLNYLKESLIKKIQEGGNSALSELLVHVFIQEEKFGAAFRQMKALLKRGAVGPDQLFRLAQVAKSNEDYRNAGKIYQFLAEEYAQSPRAPEAKIGALESRRLALALEETSERDEWEKLAAEYQMLRESYRGREEQVILSRELAEMLAYRLGDTDSARAVLLSQLSRGYTGEEERARLKIQLGDLLLYRGERWDAILYYGQAEKAFEQSPIGQEAKFKRAQAAYFVGEFEWAQGIFDVLKQSTSKLIANDAMQYSLLISANSALDTTYEAMEQFARADFHFYRDQYDSALVIFDRMEIAFAEHEIMDEVLLRKGDIYQKRGEYEQARQSWEQLLQDFPRDILVDDALMRLARLELEVFDSREKAMELYQQIFIEHPDSYYTPEARKRFRELRGDSIN